MKYYKGNHYSEHGSVYIVYNDDDSCYKRAKRITVNGHMSTCWIKEHISRDEITREEFGRHIDNAIENLGKIHEVSKQRMINKYNERVAELEALK